MRARRLTAGEAALAARVFGRGLDPRPVRLVAQGFTRGTAVVVGPLMFFPVHEAAEDFAAADLRRRAWFVHELTHAWQFQTRPLWTLLSWARTALGGGYGPGLPGYRYPWPLPPFAALNLEQQAAAVEHAYALAEGGCPAAAPAGVRAQDYAPVRKAVLTAGGFARRPR